MAYFCGSDDVQHVCTSASHRGRSTSPFKSAFADQAREAQTMSHSRRNSTDVLAEQRILFEAPSHGSPWPRRKGIFLRLTHGVQSGSRRSQKNKCRRSERSVACSYVRRSSEADGSRTHDPNHLHYESWDYASFFFKVAAMSLLARARRVRLRNSFATVVTTAVQRSNDDIESG